MTYRNVHYLLTEKHASLLHCDQFLEYTHAQGEKKKSRKYISLRIHFFALFYTFQNLIMNTFFQYKRNDRNESYQNTSF